MKILLVRPKTDFSDMILGIPIGLSLLAAAARKEGHEVHIQDLALETTPERARKTLGALLAERSFDLAGITCMTVEYEGARQSAGLIRQAQPDCRIVLGGQHPTIQTAKVLKDACADFLAVGEGEETFRELLSRLGNRQDTVAVPGLYSKNRGEWTGGSPRPLIQDLDQIPFPAYDMLSMERYFTMESARYTPKHPRAMQIFTSRGCPWQCIYCHSLFGKKFRARSAASVLAEMQLLHERYGVGEFMIEDDVFNLDLERAKEICDRIIQSGMKVYLQFGNGLRLERFDPELAQKLAQAGTHHIAIGIESASPRIQAMIRKNVRLDHARQVIGWLRRNRIRTLGFFMIGFPFETGEEIRQTIQYAAESDLDEALFSIVVPYPGTELHRMVTEAGLYDPEQVGAGGAGLARLRSEHWDFAALRRLQRRAYLTFFLRRARFLRVLPRLANPKLARKYGKALLRNFFPFALRSSSRIN